MDLPYLINFSLWFLTAVMFLGGCVSYVIQKIVHVADRNSAWDSRHRAEWNKEGDLVPFHKDCFTCEINVVDLGGLQPAHSSVE